MRNYIILSLLFSLAGCASPVRSSVAPGHEMMVHNQIAISPVPDFPGAPASGQAATNEWVRELMTKKVTTQLLEGGGLQALSDQARKKGFNYFIYASFTRYQPGQRYLLNQTPNQTSVYLPGQAYPGQAYPARATVYSSGGGPVSIPGGAATTQTTTGVGMQQQILMTNATIGMTAQMVEASTGNIIWTGAYSYEALDVESALEGIVSYLAETLPGPK